MSNLLDKSSIVLTPTAYDNGKVLCVKPSDGSGDFDFSRNSAATRVNAQGLVEDIQILSSNLVQNGSFSQLGSQDVTNGNFSQQGSQLITNGDFATDSNWTLISGVTYNVGGYLDFDGSQGTGSVANTPNTTFTLNKTYKVVYEIKNYTSGTIKFRFQNGVNTIGQQQSGDGVKTEYIVCNDSSNNNFNFFGSSSFIGSIDNVSVVEVGQDWTIASGSGWSIGEDKIIGVNSLNFSAYQPTLVSGKTYKITYEVKDYVSGTFGIRANTAAGLTVTANGVYTDYITSNGNKVYLMGFGTFNGSVTNISVKEVGQNWDLGTGWNIGDDKAIALDAAFGSQLIDSTTLTASKKYSISFNISNYVKGSVRIGVGNAFSSDVSSNGDYTFILTAVNTNAFKVQTRSGGSGTSLSITNISVIEITEDTNLPRINYEGFSYQDALGSELYDGNINQAINGGTWTDNGDGTFIVTGNGTPSVGVGVRDFNAEYLTIGKNYLITAISDNLTIAIYSSSFALLTSGASPLYFTPTTTSTKIYLSPTDGITATYSNVSVKEYKGQEVVPDSGCGSWLWEPQSTNLITQSEALSTIQFQSVVTDNNLISPTGDINASLVVENTATNPHGIRKTAIIPTNPSATTYTISIFAKKKERQYIQFSAFADGTTFNSSGFDLENGTTLGNASTHKILDFGNGWYRCSFIANITQATGGFNFVRISMGTSINSFFYAGDGTSGLYMFGYQVEQQSSATSYIPTDGSQKTRNQDLCTNGGSLASINSSEGVLYFEGSALLNGGATNRIISLSDGTNDNIIQFRYGITANRFTSFIRGNGGSFGIKTINGVSQTDNHKIALVWDATSLRIYVDGLQAGSVATNDLPIGLNQLKFTQAITGAEFFGKTKCLAVWKEALTDTELQELTTI